MLHEGWSQSQIILFPKGLWSSESERCPCLCACTSKTRALLGVGWDLSEPWLSCRPGRPWTHSDPPASTSQGLRVKVCSTMLGLLVFLCVLLEIRLRISRMLGKSWDPGVPCSFVPSTLLFLLLLLLLLLLFEIQSCVSQAVLELTM